MPAPTTLNLGLSSASIRLDRRGTLRETRWRLEVKSGPDRGASVEVDGVVVVGTRDDATLRLTDPAVSRRHATIEVRGDAVRIRDLGSRNGTFSSGMRVKDVVVALEGRLEVRVGETALMLAPVESELSVERGLTRFGDALGVSAAMQKLFGVLARVAPTPTAVLLTGETGTGKDVLARAVHAKSPRAASPLVVVDCASLSAELAESELFGHVKGAFTGASADRRGAFLRAHRGTVFLDEVGELPLSIQPKLLRVLEGGSLRRVGEDVERAVDVRVIAATHRDLDAEVAAGRFRADLLFRLAVVCVRVPALRERPEDIPLLAEHFLGRPLPKTVKATLMAQRWAGNVRELRNVVERLRAEGAVEDAPAAELSFKDARDRIFDAFARDYLSELLELCRGNVSEVARRAGLHRNYVQRLVERYGLSRGSSRR